VTRLSYAVVLANALVLLLHDAAHRDLGIPLDAWQKAFVYTVIVPGPIVALLVLHRAPRGGYALLLVSMLGSLLFGLHHHYGVVSPDHVDHLPAGEARALFRLTAFSMAFVEAAGVVVAVLGLRRVRSRA
jgi:hypothetical protein